MRVEHSRRHGPFDPRCRPIRHKPSPPSLWPLGEQCLDWQGFLARFFPDSRRHYFDAVAAHESYRKGADGRTRAGAPSAALATSSIALLTPRLDAAESGGDDGEPTADTDRWETDGGASAARPRRKGGSGQSERSEIRSHEREGSHKQAHPTDRGR